MNAEDIKKMIAAGLNCSYLELDGDGQHWFAVIVSNDFEGVRPVARHQKVYATLGDKIKTNEVHALSMQVYTDAEWKQKQNG